MSSSTARQRRRMTGLSSTISEQHSMIGNKGKCRSCASGLFFSRQDFAGVASSRESAHQVEGAARLEPGDLFLIEGVDDLEAFGGSVRMSQGDEQVFSGGEGGEADYVHPIVFTHLVVVGGVGELEGQQSLLLEIGLVDAGHAFGYHGAGAQETRGHGRMLAGGGFSVILRPDY